MKIKEIDKLENFVGTVIIPVLKLVLKNYPIAFEGIEISSKVFYGKKNSQYLLEKQYNVLVCGFRKTIIMPT
jgi:leucyl aminopeptidase